MNTQFDEAQFKQRTREMVAFFKEKGVEVPLTLGYEGVARYLFGAKSWNNLSSELRKGLVSPTIVMPAEVISADTDAALSKEPKLKYLAYENGREKVSDMAVFASFYSSDGQLRADFPVTQAVRVVPDEIILRMASLRWSDPKFMEPMAVFRRGDNPDVRKVLKHVENRPGLEVLGGIDRRDIVRYVRAFRPHLLAKVLLLEKFGTLPNAAVAGFSVRAARAPNLGKWTAKSNHDWLEPVDSASKYFVTQADAWNAVAFDLLELEGEFEVSDLFDVMHGSGSFES